MELSIVSTIYNDSETIELLVSEFVKTVTPLNISFEIILVNDASSDDSEETIKKVTESNSNVKGVSLARNYGQQIAVSAGVKYATGKYVLIIDGDLENPISAIPELYKKIQEGYDVVYTVSKVRQSFHKRVTSQLFWFVICKLLKINIVKNQLLLRIMSRRMVDNYNTYGEITRSVAGINHDIGLKETKIEVVPNKRVAGSSNYNFSKRLNMFLDIVLNMSFKPLQFVIILGFFTFIFSLSLSVYFLYVYVTIGSVPGFTSTILAVFFFGSSILFILGLISRYLALIYLEVKNRPLFLIKEKFNI